MKKKIAAIFLMIIFNAGCAAPKNVLSQKDGYEPVSLDNKDATVLVKVSGTIIEPLTIVIKYKKDKDDKNPIIVTQKNQKTVPMKEEPSGSGVVISKGFILTAYHVISSDDERTVREVCVSRDLDKSECVVAKIVATDPEKDLAVLKVKNDKLFPKTVKLGTKKELFDIGRKIYNFGFPHPYDKTLTIGYLSTPASSKNGLLTGQAPLGFGTSGSGIFDMKTHALIGLMRKIWIDPYVNIRRFIPADVIKKFLNKNKIPYHSAKGR